MGNKIQNEPSSREVHQLRRFERLANRVPEDLLRLLLARSWMANAQHRIWLRRIFPAIARLQVQKGKAQEMSRKAMSHLRGAQEEKQEAQKIAKWFYLKDSLHKGQRAAGGKKRHEASLKARTEIRTVFIEWRAGRGAARKAGVATQAQFAVWAVDNYSGAVRATKTVERWMADWNRELKT